MHCVGLKNKTLIAGLFMKSQINGVGFDITKWSPIDWIEWIGLNSMENSRGRIWSCENENMLNSIQKNQCEICSVVHRELVKDKKMYSVESI